MAGKLSRNFDWKEFTKSDTATRLHIINEVTTWEVRDNIKALVDNILQPLRDAWGQPLFINSGYRCLKLNAAVGGVPTSQHVMGMAADVGCSNPYELAKLAVKLKLDFDQMIIYPTFVHLSYDKDGRNRGQILYNKRYKGAKDL
jgi:uncharacterized protein YcbK (DUF882 family)